jgi:hypothetical protein
MNDAAIDEAAIQRGQLRGASQALEARLVRFRKREGWRMPPSDKRDGQTGPSVFRGRTPAVRDETALKVDRCSGIERPIAAGQDVDGRKVAR